MATKCIKICNARAQHCLAYKAFSFLTFPLPSASCFRKVPNVADSRNEFLPYVCFVSLGRVDTSNLFLHQMNCVNSYPS